MKREDSQLKKFKLDIFNALEQTAKPNLTSIYKMSREPDGSKKCNLQKL